MNRFIGFVLCLLISPISIFAAQDEVLDLTTPTIPIEQIITGRVNDFIKNNQIYLTYLITKGDSIVTKGASGLFNIEKNTKLEEGNIFPTASISQNFAATTALLLQERGKLKVSDPISKYLPKNSGYWSRGKMPAWADKVTIHHLLTHSHGLPEMYEYVIRTKEEFNLAPKFLLASLTSKKLLYEPGEKAVYSNTGFLVLELILEKILAMPLDKFYQEEFFDKLDMKNSFSVIPGLNNALNKKYDETKLPAQYYASTLSENIEEIGIMLVNSRWATETIGQVNTGIYTNVEDLNKWNIALHNGKILSQESYEQMIKPYYRADSNDEGFISHFGYGIQISRNLGKIQFYHQYSNFPGVRAEMAYVPAHKVFISMIGNLYLEDVARQKYKSKTSKISDISDLRNEILETIRENYQTQAVFDNGNKSSQ